MFHRITLTTAAALLTAGPALAGGFAAPVVVAAPSAPVVVAPSPVIVSGSDWSGGYIGGQLGFGRLSLDDNDDVVEPLEDEEFDGALYGVHAGYMFDFGRIVAGAEVDFDGTQINITDEGAEGEEMDIAQVGSIARAKLRVGFDAGRVLPYVTAGVARVTLDSDDALTEAALEDSYSGNFVGLGASYAVSERFMVGVEALRHNFDDTPIEGVEAQVNTITLRGSIRF